MVPKKVVCAFIIISFILGTLSACNMTQSFNHRVSIRIEGGLHAESRRYEITKDGYLVGIALLNINDSSADIYHAKEHRLSNKDQKELNRFIEEIKKNPNQRDSSCDGGQNVVVGIDNAYYRSIYFPKWYLEGENADSSKVYANRKILDLVYFVLNKLPLQGKDGNVPEYYCNQ